MMSGGEETTGRVGVWPKNRNCYVLGDVIGAGITAIVHRAFCKPRNELCAIKRIRIDKENRNMHQLIEIKNLITTNHKNVVNYFTLFVIEDELWLVLSLLQGGSMLDIINHKQKLKDCSRGVLDETTIASVLRKVLKALECIHRNGLVHRDIKAENMFLSGDSDVQIGAFGLSAYFAMGRNHFTDKSMQNIMESAKLYDPKSDIWSLGISAMELVTGKSPYQEYHAKKIPMSALQNNPLKIKLDYLSSVQYKDYEKLKNIIVTCLENDPTRRPSATQLLKDPFFKKAKNSKALKQTLSPFIPHMNLRALRIKTISKHLPEITGWRYQQKSKKWVWSTADKENQTDSKRQPSTVPVVDNLINF